MKVHLEYRDETSSKFWEIEVVGASHRVRYGKIGAAGKTLVKEFENEALARSDAEKLAAAKRKAGYHDVALQEQGSGSALAAARIEEALKAGDPVWNDGGVPSQNTFEYVLKYERREGYAVRALLSNAIATEANGQLIWNLHISPIDGRKIAFAVHHVKGFINEVVPASIFEAAYQEGRLMEEYSVDGAGFECPNEETMAPLYASLAPDWNLHKETAKKVLDHLWERSGWLGALLRGDVREADRLEPEFKSSFESEAADIPHVPAYALYWLWRGYFLCDDALVEDVMRRAEGSTVPIIRDAVSLMREIQSGRRSIPKVEDIHAIRTRFQPTLKAMSKKEDPVKASTEAAPTLAAGARAGIRSLYLEAGDLSSIEPSLTTFAGLERLYLHGNPSTEFLLTICELPNLRELVITEHSIQAIPPEIAKLQKLEKLVFTAEYPSSDTTLPSELTALSRLRVLDLNGSRVPELPANLGALAKLETLNLRKNGLTTLPSSIGDLANLVELDLSENALEELPKSMGQLSRLRELNLSGNQSLRTLPRGIAQLKSLETLKIDVCSKFLLSKECSELKSLREMQVYCNAWEDEDEDDISRSIHNVPQLERLNLHVDNQLPDSFTELPVLKHLELSLYSGAEFEQVYAQLSKFRAVESFVAKTLDENVSGPVFDALCPLASQLRKLVLGKLPESWGSLDERIAEFTNLEELTLIGVDNLPKGVSKLRNLRRLDVTEVLFGDIEALPESLPHLEELRIGKNELPAGLERLEKLTVLIATGSSSQKLPEDLSGLKSLCDLNLDSSAITELPESLQSLSALERLSISFLSPADATLLLERVSLLPRLKGLWMESSELRRLPDSFSRLTSLEDLVLSGNHSLDMDEAIAVLARLPKLKTLDLSGMLLRELPASVQGLRALKTLDLQNNRLPPAEINRIRCLLPDTVVLT